MTQRRVLKCGKTDAKMNALAGRLAATETNQYLDFQASAVRPAAEGSGIVNVDSVWPNNNFQISVDYVPHLEKVYSNLRQKNGRKSGDDMKDLDTNSLIWGMFMSVTLDAAVHRGKDYLENLHSTQNQQQRTIRHLFDVAKELITDRTAILGFSKTDWHTHPWQKDHFVNCQSSPSINSKSLCILPFRIVSEQDESILRVHRNKKIQWSRVLLTFESWIERREPIEFEWNFSQDSLHYRFSLRFLT